MEEIENINSQTFRQELKQEAIKLLRSSINSLIDDLNYLILQYGSSFFGSETKESDYDIILVCPISILKKFLQPNKSLRDTFFFEELASHIISSNTLETIKVHSVQNAKVPILKMKFKNCLNIDLSFAIVSNDQIETTEIHNYQPIDSQTESTLQAVIICQEIKNKIIQTSIPFEIFSLFLYQVKNWAQQRQIYGQQYGFLGGISWAILCGNIFITYSNSKELYNNQKNFNQAVLFLLQKFFRFYLRWQWPYPITLNTYFNQSENGDYKFDDKNRNWNPISSAQDSKHLMPVLTPHITFENSTFSCHSFNTAECITQSSVQVYQYEMERAYKMVKKILKQKLQFEDLFQKYDSFVVDGKINQDGGFHFVIQIEAISRGSQQDERNFYYHDKFLMTIESKIRSLLVSLDTQLNPQNEFQCLIRPMIKPIKTIEQEDDQETYCSKIYIGLKQLYERDMGVIDITLSMEHFLHKIQAQIPECLSKELEYFIDHTVKLNVIKGHLNK